MTFNPFRDIRASLFIVKSSPIKTQDMQDDDNPLSTMSEDPSSTPGSHSEAQHQVQHFGRALIRIRLAQDKIARDIRELQAIVEPPKHGINRTFLRFRSRDAAARRLDLDRRQLEDLKDQQYTLEFEGEDAGEELLRSAAFRPYHYRGIVFLTLVMDRWYAKEVTGRFLPEEILGMVVFYLYPLMYTEPYLDVSERESVDCE